MSTNTKHTSGPWRLSTNKVEGYILVCPKEESKLLSPICEIDVHPNVKEEAIANAKLIAAAPELLDALLAANEYIKRISDPIGYQQFGTEAIQKATS